MSPLEWAVVGASVGSMLLAVRHWWGWALGAASEVLWAAYALRLHARGLLVMSGIWFLANARNAIVARSDRRAET